MAPSRATVLRAFSFSEGSKVRTVSRPSSRARADAMSAAARSASGASPCRGETASPPLNVTWTSRPWRTKGLLAAARIFSTTTAASSESRTSRRRPNSSPERRATVSVSRTAPFSRVPTLRRSSSPSPWPSESLRSLNPSTSSARTATERWSRLARRRAWAVRSRSIRRFGRPVRASCPAMCSSWAAAATAAFRSASRRRMTIPRTVTTARRTSRELRSVRSGWRVPEEKPPRPTRR